MREQELYTLWKEKAVEDPDLAAELQSIEGDETAITDRFYADMEFGTAGLRGIIGAGTIRMNFYTVRRATQGYANYLNNNFDSPSVAISFDSRIKSDLFAKETAAIFAANGIKVHIFPELEPTPVLSFAVRYFKAKGGVMVTASHNPAKYNGYKAYGPDGCQMTQDAADEVTREIEKVDLFDGITKIPYEDGVQSGMISVIGPEVLEAYLDEVQKQAVNPGIAKDLKVVYTPLNGTGNKPVRAILKRCGLENVTVVPEQELPDGNFPTAPFPNPEIRQSFECALKLAPTVNPDILLATDPDCDRVGIAVHQGDEFILMTGNEVGVMLLNYICSQRIAKGNWPKNPIAVKTIVTSALCFEIAAKYGVELIEVLTGFKFIGEQIGLLEAKNEQERYIFGFEESYGYLAGTYVRDKDAVVASMLICEMAAFYKNQGKTLYEVMQELYAEHGYYLNSVQNIVCEGAAGMAELQSIMEGLRANGPKELAGRKVISAADYELSEETNLATGEKKIIELPKSNVLSYNLEGGAQVIVRPSGTEPKVKIYYTTKGKDRADAQAQTEALQADINHLLGR